MLRSWWVDSVAALLRISHHDGSRRSWPPSAPLETRKRSRQTFQPQLLGLEDRWCPATFTVDATTDTGAGSGNSGDLRYCISQANSTSGADAIVFDSTVFATAQTITLGGTQLILTDTTGATTITGPAAGVTVSGNNLSGVFVVNAGVSASLSGLTITGGYAVTGLGNGGGVYNRGLVTLTNCTVSGNSAVNEGGGVYNRGLATLTNCTVSGNSANDKGGGVSNSLYGTATLTDCTVSGNSAISGGGVFNYGTATLANCTVSGNFATFGGGVSNRGLATLTNCTVSGNGAAYGGGMFNEGTATLTNCTVSGNTAYLGGGMFNDPYATATLTNCTVSGNTATNGGGVWVGYYGTATLTNCTVSGNTATNGGGVFNDRGTTTLTNTIVAGQTSGGDVNGSLAATSANNLIGNGTGSSGITNGTNGNQVGTSAAPINPLLAPLGNYGGPTQTMAPLAGSPAIDAGTSTGAPATDQRGASRFGGVDIGAFEVFPTNRVVSTTDDIDDGDYSAGNLSLREAIFLANVNPGDDTITFDSTVFATAQTITLGGTQLTLTDTTGATTITSAAVGVTINAAVLSRVFVVSSSVTASLSGLTITGGNANTGGGGTAGFVPGGGVYNRGTVTLTNCTISGNTSSLGGGGVYNRGTATLTNCTISGNSASNGGGMFNEGTATLTNCTISGNSASNSGGGLLSRGTATLTNCTISGNFTNSIGGGLSNLGTGTLTNCTVNGNTTINYGGGVYNDGTVTLTNCTISGNSSSNNIGGGVYNGGTATLINTIVAKNTGPYPDISGPVAPTSSNNLIGVGTGSSGITNGTNGNQVGTTASPIDPLLAPLGDYGGPTQTMALLPGSAAIDAGTPTGAPSTDQRGNSRVGGVDIGAFESSGFTIAVISGSGQSAKISTAFTAPLVAKVTANNASEPVAGGKVTFTPPGTGASATLTGSPATIATNGNVSVTATANGNVGTYAVAATARGVTTATNFSLTNTRPDTTRPKIRISPPSLPAVRAGGVVTFTITYADADFNTSTLTAANIRLNRTGTANGTIVVTGTGKTRTVTIRNITGNGTLSISIAAGTATDKAGNLAPAAGPSIAFVVRPFALVTRPRRGL